MRHVPWSQGTDFSHGVKAPHACLVTFAIRQEHAAFQTFQGIIAVSKQLESLKRAVFIQPAMCSCCSPPTAHLLTWEPAADGQKDRSLSFVCPIASTQRHMGGGSTPSHVQCEASAPVGCHLAPRRVVAELLLL